MQPGWVKMDKLQEKMCSGLKTDLNKFSAV